MKKERAIIIKDPKVQKIRNELRTLLNLWRSDIIFSLMDQSSQYAKDKDKSREIQKKISDLNLQFKLSICVCLHCGRSDQDMIFIPDWKQWLCIDCNSERVHYDKLRADLQMTNRQLGKFFDRLRIMMGLV